MVATVVLSWGYKDVNPGIQRTMIYLNYLYIYICIYWAPNLDTGYIIWANHGVEREWKLVRIS